MHADTVNQLLQLNREFYQTFANQFSDTRQRIQPGVRKIIATIPETAQILDLGCGNGELVRQLLDQGFSGTYLGLDFSAELLEVARQGLNPNASIYFTQADLGEPGWAENAIPTKLVPFDTIFAFATLHHIPSQALQHQLLTQVNQLLIDGGQFIHSNWQFLNSERLRARIQPWERIGLDASQLEPGDYLLDWRRGGEGLRYVHHFSSQELAQLAAETGFVVIDEFLSDGEGGNLGLYQVWQKIAPA